MQTTAVSTLGRKLPFSCSLIVWCRVTFLPLASSADSSTILRRAYEQTRQQLLDARDGAGHWTGELSTSALSTATAVSALALYAKATGVAQKALIEPAVRWLAEHQNADGGWGDTDRSHSNIATTMLVRAAFHLADIASGHAAALGRAESYIDKQGGIPGLRRRYGVDKTFAVPILTNAALAGLVPWSDVSPLPFELAWLPHRWYRLARMPVVSYAIPALVAIGQARFHHRPPWFPPLRWLRTAAIKPTLQVIQRMQPDSGGYLEAIPLTSFVVMSLAASGRAEHAVTRRGIDFIHTSVRPDGSWPIDTNLATWNTSLALHALAAGGEDLPSILASSPLSTAPGGNDHRGNDGSVDSTHPGSASESADDCLAWLLRCQNRHVHPFTQAAPGGWGWTNLSGAVPDADDTPAALLALAAWRRSPRCAREQAERIDDAVTLALPWLLDLQNGDGGWPTFCRGWGKLPFDRSGADLTAHAIRALTTWRDHPAAAAVRSRIEPAIERGFHYLAKHQQSDGHWLPLWFGNQDHPREENPVYGTAKVLLAYEAVGRSESAPAQRAADWLRSQQQADGSWGSVEETALAVEALCGVAAPGDAADAIDRPLTMGLDWLIGTVETNRHLASAPIGLYFARLWYYEQLYPLTFTVAALGRALRRRGR